MAMVHNVLPVLVFLASDLKRCSQLQVLSKCMLGNDGGRGSGELRLIQCIIAVLALEKGAWSNGCRPAWHLCWSCRVRVGNQGAQVKGPRQAQLLQQAVKGAELVYRAKALSREEGGRHG